VKNPYGHAGGFGCELCNNCYTTEAMHCFCKKGKPDECNSMDLCLDCYLNFDGIKQKK
jgi:hypothetical protein